MTARFVPALDLQIVVDEAADPGYIEAAGEIVVVARDAWPNRTGDYNASLRVTVDERGVVAETTDRAGHIIEYGSRRQEPQAPIRKGAAEVGEFEPK
jgi:hypothetical protein